MDSYSQFDTPELVTLLLTWGKHGGWADGSTAQTGYVLDSASNALTVPKALAL